MSKRTLGSRDRNTATFGTVLGCSEPAAALGEHTDEVLREIGYSEAEITALRKKEVV